MSSNLALYIPSPHAPFSLGHAEIPEPGPHELVIKNTSVALNPLDYKIQQSSAFPVSYPYIAGVSFAGTVEKVGSALQTKFRRLDRVAAGRISSHSEPGEGVFQQYVLAHEDAVAKLDETVSLDDASAVIPSIISVVGALHVCMGLSLPDLNHTHNQNHEKKILVYGGSSTLGMRAAEYAMQAGYTVVTTSSPANRAQVSRFCPQAVAIIDHTIPVEEALVKAIVSEGPYDYIFDAIGTPATTSIVAKAVLQLNCTSSTTTTTTIWSSRPGGTEDLLGGVQRRGESYPHFVEEDEGVRRWLFEEYLPLGLTSKTISVPDIEKVGGGLGSIPGLLDRMRGGGISGKKLVVDPWETEQF